MEKRCFKCFITVAAETSVHGTAKGNLENSSTTVRRYRFLVLVGRGPLKSRLSLSNGEVAFIKFPSNLWKRGFSSAQIWHELVTLFTSSIEKGRFLIRTQWFSRVIPGWQSAECKALRSIFEVTAAVTLEKASAHVFSLPGR